MGIAPEELASRYPCLYHMAHRDSWPGIRELGLLSTTVLLDVYGKKGQERERLESQHRPDSVKITHSNRRDAVIRDQKPMSEESLRRALKSSGLEPSDWYRILNGKVFFWLTEERLNRLLGAAAYREHEHCVLTVDTRTLLADYERDVRLCPINSGCTKPYPWPRGNETFLTMGAYPFDQWLRKRRGVDPVVEVAVEKGVPDITRYVLRVEIRQVNEILNVVYAK